MDKNDLRLAAERIIERFEQHDPDDLGQPSRYAYALAQDYLAAGWRPIATAPR
jgi:hypothetical protein